MTNYADIIKTVFQIHLFYLIPTTRLSNYSFVDLTATHIAIAQGPRPQALSITKFIVSIEYHKNNYLVIYILFVCIIF